MKLLATKSNVFYSGQWMFKIGWPNMGALNVEAADSFLQKDLNRPLYFIVDQCKKQPTREIPPMCPGAYNLVWVFGWAYIRDFKIVSKETNNGTCFFFTTRKEFKTLNLQPEHNIT